jgi:ketol-acid reductoisomerase
MGNYDMMDRLNNPSKIEAYRLADELKDIMRPFQKHMDDIISGEFSKT